MPKGLIRIYGQGDWHFITCSCYRRRPFLGSARHRDLFLEVLEQTRKKYQFVVAGYVVMPEHIHLLIGEPRIADPSRVMQVLKQRVSLQCLSRKNPAKQDLLTFGGQLPPSFWLPRSHDFNVGTKKKYVEKLNYIHFNPVKHGRVADVAQWPHSSFHRHVRAGLLPRDWTK